MDFDRVCSVIDELSARVAGMIRTAPDPSAPAVGEWSLEELAAHLAAMSELQRAYAAGEGSPVASFDGLAAFNEERLREYVSDGLPALADRIEAGMKQTVEELRGAGADRVVPWIAGLEITTGELAGVIVGEFLVHGHDVARAVGAPWRIDPAHANVVFEAVAPLMPRYVDEEAARGFSGVFDLRMRGGSRRHLVFENGGLTIEEPGARRVDCHISADPVAFLLVGYGRIGPLAPALTGKMVAWGRRPWLGFKLPRLLKQP
ncbi:MAG: maleylpyruvate isomerase family mycothiol-dependent enzyme [Actinomycetota bacterium]